MLDPGGVLPDPTVRDTTWDTAAAGTARSRSMKRIRTALTQPADEPTCNTVLELTVKSYLFCELLHIRKVLHGERRIFRSIGGLYAIGNLHPQGLSLIR
jgi:hypothetical protein